MLILSGNLTLCKGIERPLCVTKVLSACNTMLSFFIQLHNCNLKLHFYGCSSYNNLHELDIIMSKMRVFITKIIHLCFFS